MIRISNLHSGNGELEISGNDVQNHDRLLKTFSPDGKQLAVANWSGTLELFDSVTGSRLWQSDSKANDSKHITRSFLIPVAASLSPVTNLEILCNGIQTQERKKGVYSAGAFSRLLCFSPDGRHLMSPVANEIQLLNSQTLELEGTLSLRAWAALVAIRTRLRVLLLERTENY